MAAYTHLRGCNEQMLSLCCLNAVANPVPCRSLADLLWGQTMMSKSQSPPPEMWLKAAVGEERNLKRNLFLRWRAVGSACNVDGGVRVGLGVELKRVQKRGNSEGTE